MHMSTGSICRGRGELHAVRSRILVVTFGGTLWCFRDVLERWTYEKAERRFRTGTNPNCSVTWYRHDDDAKRLRLAEAGRVFWK